MAEEKFGLDALGQLLANACDQGVYTVVGNYDHKDLVRLIVQLSKQTDTSAEELQRVFGQSVFDNLYQSLLERTVFNIGKILQSLSSVS
ncbi:Heme NO binding protein [Vibrio aquimaris]|uniref:Heme NO binding protein n=1 Tax=Vibrio aquimaris TaxID=2587862 RepID=A0A5P9CJP5_9VIBR|nr:Heme NO binding protein [Vibrio aquimaris]